MYEEGGTPRVLAAVPNSLNYAGAEVLRRRWHLGAADCAVALVLPDEVREGTADVGRDAHVRADPDRSVAQRGGSARCDRCRFR